MSTERDKRGREKEEREELIQRAEFEMDRPSWEEMRLQVLDMRTEAVRFQEAILMSLQVPREMLYGKH
jgi:hypothetical protein